MKTQQKTLTLTSENFQKEVLEANKPFLVDFWASWCAPCRAIAPTVDQLAEEFDGSAGVGKVDVDANPNLAAEYGIQSIPTLLFFDRGKVVEKIIGGASKGKIQEKLNRFAEN